MLRYLFLILFFYTVGVFAIEHSGWNISSAYLWRLSEHPNYAVQKGSPAKIAETDRQILHHQAKFTRRESLVNSYTFKIGCMFQSTTPVFELQVQPLDVRVTDQFNGFAFARFLVDQGQEFSLRGEFLPPARLVFMPMTQSQERNLQNLFLQMREGGVLRIGLLEGLSSQAREYLIPLQGFLEFADSVANDCVNLNQRVAAGRGKAQILPDYLTTEPLGYAQSEYSLKPKPANDGLTPLTPEPVAAPEPQPDPVPVPAPEIEPTPPDIQYFQPGGGVASIGPDGRPISAPEQEENFGTAGGPALINPDGSIAQVEEQETPENNDQ